MCSRVIQLGYQLLGLGRECWNRCLSLFPFAPHVSQAFFASRSKRVYLIMSISYQRPHRLSCLRPLRDNPPRFRRD
jgi:hypothetical protein